MNKEKLESAKNLFFIALGVDIAVTALVVISDFWGIGVLKDISAGRSTADQSTISTFAFWDSFSKLLLLTTLGVGLGLVKWLNTCYSYAKDTIGASGFKNERWTAGGWIIPVFNLFKPYQVINEIYKAGSPTYAVPDGWKKESVSSLLLTWWIFWAVTHFIGWIVGKQMFKSAMRDDLTLQQSISATESHALFCMVFLIISGLWFLVAGNLTRRLLDRQRVGVAPILLGQPITVSRPVPPRNPAPTQAGTSSPTPTQMSASQSAGTTSQATANPTQFVNQSQSPTPVPLSPSTEEDFWAAAMNEVESGQRRPGIWAKAFADAEGDETKAKVGYLKARVQQLKEDQLARVAQREVELQKVAAKAAADAAAQKQAMAPLIAKFKSSDFLSVSELKQLVNHTSVDPELVTLTDRVCGNSLLHLCAKNELLEQIHTLMQYGSNPLHPNENGLRPESMTPNLMVRQILRGFGGMTVTTEQIQLIEEYGITHDGERFCVQDHHCETLTDAINIAREISGYPNMELMAEVLRGNWSAAKNLLSNGCSPHGTTPLSRHFHKYEHVYV